MGLGENARAALLARSFAELTRLGENLGARRETLMGLSGLGDLVLTAAGSSARQTNITKDTPVDSVIMSVIDSLEVGGEVVFRKS